MLELLEIYNNEATNSIMSEIKHDLEHEVYLDPKDGKEHINLNGVI